MRVYAFFWGMETKKADRSLPHLVVDNLVNGLSTHFAIAL